MAWFVIAATVVSTAVTVVGQKQAADAAEQSAKWNADQARKQADYNESVAQKNMRRERLNNKRELARRRANSARGGLMETGAVSDNLIEAAETHQTEINDIWEQAATKSHQLRGQANMSIWEGAQAKTASKYAMAGTIVKGAADVYSTGKEANWGKEE